MASGTILEESHPTRRIFKWQEERERVTPIFELDWHHCSIRSLFQIHSHKFEITVRAVVEI